MGAPCYHPVEAKVERLPAISELLGPRVSELLGPKLSLSRAPHVVLANSYPWVPRPMSWPPGYRPGVSYPMMHPGPAPGLASPGYSSYRAYQHRAPFMPPASTRMTFPATYAASYRHPSPMANSRPRASGTLPPSQGTKRVTTNAAALLSDEKDDEGASSTFKYSHKLAERKRRQEMNETFEVLKARLPLPGASYSKWEILMAASQHIESLKRVRNSLQAEETLHRDPGLRPPL